MKSIFCNTPDSMGLGAVFTLTAFMGMCSLLAGCSRSQSGSQMLEGQLKEMNVSRTATAKFAGTVTIDGRPPGDAIKDGLFILLYDPENPPKPKTSPQKSIVDLKTGAFSFTTYAQDDGVTTGTYIVLFVALKHTMLARNAGFHEPDGLKNLYNDPDKNKDNPDFNLTVTAPGKTNYSFDLKLEGQELPSSPGSHAVTQFVL